jgi:hypothetical protein
VLPCLPYVHLGTGVSEWLEMLLWLAGYNVTVALLGGSVTFGAGGEAYEGHFSYFVWLQKWAASTFPRGNVRIVNAGCPAVGSIYLSVCYRVSASVLPSL